MGASMEELTKGMRKCDQYAQFSQKDASNRRKYQSAAEAKRAAAEQEQARQYVIKVRRKMLQELYAREKREWVTFRSCVHPCFDARSQKIYIPNCINCWLFIP